MPTNRPAGAEVARELFHCCALVAFVEQACVDGGWPSPERTRQRAYRLFETANANDRSGHKSV
jgi:hypothetical protein